MDGTASESYEYKIVGFNDDVSIVSLDPGGKILDSAFSSELPDSYKYSLEVYDVDRSDNIQITKSGGDQYGHLDLPDPIGYDSSSGTREGYLTYSINQGNSPLSANSTEAYQVSASDNNGSVATQDLDINIIAAGASNVLVLEGDGAGSIDEVDFNKVSNIDLHAGEDIAIIDYEINTQEDKSFIDGGDGFDTLSLNAFGLKDAALMARQGELGDFVAFASSSEDGVWESDLFNLTATNFENVDWEKVSQDSNAVSESRLVGVSESIVDVADDLVVDYDVLGESSSDAKAVTTGASAYSELITIGAEDSTFTAADRVTFDLDFGGVSSAEGSSSSGLADAVAVGFGLGFVGVEGVTDISGSEIDLAISNISSVMADAESVVGDVMAVSSNDIVDATELMVLADARLMAELSADVETIAIASTTNGSSEAVGWQELSVLEDSSFTSGGLGLIEVDAQAINNVSAESVGLGIVTADALSHATGINDTDFSFADTNSIISSDISDTTTASASSVFGNAFSNLTSSIKGIFGGSDEGEVSRIDNAESISSIINQQGFAEASSVGGTAQSVADESAQAISTYDITTTEDLALLGQSNLASNASSNVTEV